MTLVYGDNTRGVLILQIKRGDTLAFFVQVSDVSATNFKCQIRDSAYQFVCDVSVTPTETPGRYLFKAADTSNWPIEQLVYDIKFNTNGIIRSTDTAYIDVVKDVTKYE